MAFEYFALQQVDIAIIEVGLGGRLDSTNIILPELSVITNISFHHMNMLGDTLDKIAFEKAGIIKKNTAVVVGEKNAATARVFVDKAIMENAELHFADEKRFVADWKFDKHELVAEVTSIHNNEKSYFRLDLNGIYQMKNLITVLEAVDILKQRNFNLAETDIKKGLQHVRKNTGFHGRWELVHEHPKIIFDVGHNEDGILQIVRQIEITDHEELHIVLGMVKDKETAKILACLPEHANYYFTKAQIPRALPEAELSRKAAEAGLQGNDFPHVQEALQAAIIRAGRKDLIIVCGSVFVVGEVDVAALLFKY